MLYSSYASWKSKEGIKFMIVKCVKNSSLCIAFTISQVLGFFQPFKSSTQLYFLRPLMIIIRIYAFIRRSILSQEA